MLGDPPPPLDRAAVLIFAVDHGATARGVSAYPAEVTAQMCANFADGGAAINVLTRGACGAEVRVVDVGVAADLAGLDGIEHRKVRPGTEDLSERPAMTADEVLEALAVGWVVVLGGGGRCDRALRLAVPGAGRRGDRRFPGRSGAGERDRDPARGAGGGRRRTLRGRRIPRGRPLSPPRPAPRNPARTRGRGGDLMAHAGVVHCLDVVAAGLKWEESIEQRLDFLESKRFEGKTGSDL